MKKLVRNNSLSIVFFVLFALTMIGQAYMGLQEYNEDMLELGGKQVSFGEYTHTGHFIESTFENWESEFLQMALFIWLSIFLFQKGSSESKDPDKKEEVDREPDPKRKDAPWPVKKGGLVLALYSRSLSIVFFLLFLTCFCMHWYGSLREYNHEQVLRGQVTKSAFEYLSSSRLWFESLENWQSEFLSVFAIVVLTIFLRQKGSAQSKPVDASNEETGD